MMIETKAGMPIRDDLLHKYFRKLVNLFFKILPLRESEESSLITYMQSLQRELIGCNNLIPTIQDDPEYLTLLSILQFFIEHPDTDVRIFKREVFRAISICNKLEAKGVIE